MNAKPLPTGVMDAANAREGFIAFHPLANLFPLVEGAEFDELVADIWANGLREPIVIHQAMVLDGRNRYRAAIAAGRLTGGSCTFPGVPRTWREGFRGFDPAEDGDPLAYVISKNLRRRHLDESQRSMVAARIATLRDGQRSDLVEGLPIGRASEMLNVGERSTARAREVLDRGTPELADAVSRGQVSVSAAAEIVKAMPLDEQRALVLEVAKSPDTKRAFAGAVKELRQEKQEGKRDQRADRERELGEKQRELPAQKFGVILADPEWRFEPYSRETGMDRAADNHYPTSASAEIAARPVGELAADDCALFLWATVPMLPDALAVMAAWGFAYRSHVVWKKKFAGNQKGTGYWWRNEHELLLLGVRGKPPAPAPGLQWSSVVNAPVGRHSEKPDNFHEMIEAYFPTLPKIELNARRVRPGWAAWGLEAPGAHDPRAVIASGVGGHDNFIGQYDADDPPNLAALVAGLAGVKLEILNERLHVRAVAARLADGVVISALDARYLGDIARKYGVAAPPPGHPVPPPPRKGAVPLPRSAGEERGGAGDGYLTDVERVALASAFSPASEEVEPCP